MCGLRYISHCLSYLFTIMTITSSEASKRALIIGSNGSEEMELIITSDILRRAGVQVIIAGLQDQPTIICAKNTKLQVDRLLQEVLHLSFDAIILPGGQPGSDLLAADERVGTLLRSHEQSYKILAAICAAPFTFVRHGIAQGGQFTAYPSFRNEIIDAGYQYSEEDVCHWKNVITSRGPGTTFEFALTLVSILTNTQQATRLRKELLIV